MKSIFVKLSEFFSEENGRLSNVRFNSTLIVLGGLLYPYAASKLDEFVITYSLGLITLGMGGKLISKVTETKTNVNNPQ
jgi:hypothetical protein